MAHGQGAGGAFKRGTGLMPLPKTKDPGKVISKLNQEKPSMPRKQKIAIALNVTGKSKRKGK